MLFTLLDSRLRGRFCIRDAYYAVCGISNSLIVSGWLETPAAAVKSIELGITKASLDLWVVSINRCVPLEFERFGTPGLGSSDTLEKFDT